MRDMIALTSSLLICGTGHWLKGYPKRGATFFGTFLVCFILALGSIRWMPTPINKVLAIGFGILALWVWLYNLIDICTLNTSLAPTPYSQKAEERYRQALALYLQGERMDARMVFEQIIRENKRDQDCYFQLGKIACEENNPKLADKHFNKCLSLHGGDKWAEEIHELLNSIKKQAIKLTTSK